MKGNFTFQHLKVNNSESPDTHSVWAFAGFVMWWKTSRCLNEQARERNGAQIVFLMECITVQQYGAAGW